MRNSRLFTSAVITTALVALAACAGHNAATLPATNAVAPAARGASLVPVRTRTQRIAVSTCEPCSTFQLGPSAENLMGTGLKTTRVITSGIAAPWVGLTFDRAGNLYVANCTTCLTGQNGVNNVVKIRPGTNAPSLTITNGVTFPFDLVLDGSGTLYVSNLGCYSPSVQCQVSEYAKGYTSGPPTLAVSVQYPLGLAIDKEGYLYVANCMLCSNGQVGNDQILVYAPGTTSPARTITTGVNEPVALAIDSSDDLYVANCMNCGLGAGAYVTGTDSITEYAKGSSTPMKTIAFSAIDVPFTLALDASADLYVGNFAANTVTEYPPGNTNPSRTMSQGVSSPAGIAVDKYGALYVSNAGNGTVTKYSTRYQSGPPNKTVTVSYPSSIAISPP